MSERATEGIRFNTQQVSDVWYRGVTTCPHGTTRCDFYQFLPWTPPDLERLEADTRHNHDLMRHCNCPPI